MSGWGQLELMSKTMLKYTSKFGAHWHCLTYIGRFLAASLCQGIFGDDQFMFQCDTIHTGCKLGCFNRHSPMSVARFFQMLILFISLPKMFFYLYVSQENAEYEREKLIYNKAKQKAEEEFKKKLMDWQKKVQAGMKELPKPDPVQIPEPQSLKDAKLTIKKNYYMGSAMEVLWSSSIVKAHLIHFVVLLVLEFLGLLMLNWLTQAAIGVTEWTFFNPKFYNFVEHYVCQENAVSLLNDEQLYNCGNGDQTECYVSRPAEKKVFLWYMICTALASIVLLILDIVLIVTTHMKKKKQKKAVAKSNQLENRSNYSEGHLSNGSIKKPLLPQ